MSPTLVFACRDPDPLAQAFTRGLRAHGIDVTWVIEEEAAVLAAAGAGPCLLGGFSRGARLAATVAHEAAPLGLVLLGYPFHPKGQPKERGALDVLAQVGAPSLVLQGERDLYGNRQQIRAVSEHVEIVWLPDGNHRWVPRAASGLTHDDLMAQAVRRAVAFTQRLA